MMRNDQLRQLSSVGRRRLLHVTIAAALVLSCGKDSPTAPRTAVVGNLVIVSGAGQEGIAGEELPAPLAVKVLDQEQRPLAGQVVNFRVTVGGGSVFAGTAVTNSSGIASERWTLGTTAGPQALEARAVSPDGLKQVFGTFLATAKAGPATTVSVVAGNAQQAVAGNALADSIVVQVADKHGNGVAAASVTWSVTGGGGAMGPASSVTGANGVAKAAWTLGGTAGVNSAEASVPSLPPVALTATGTVGTPAHLDIVSGDGQTGAVANQLAAPFIVRVTDAHENAVPGASVTWGVFAGGGSLTATSSVTTTTGTASSALTLGPGVGTNTVHASAGGMQVTFNATAVAGAGSSLTLASGDNQSAPTASALPQPLSVRVRDSNGNGVAGVIVTWAVTAGSGSISDDGPTNGEGYASAHWTLGAYGENTATASAVGVTVSFRATATVPPTATFAKVSGDQQTGLVYTVAAQPLLVRATDESGHPVAGAPVTWQATPGSAWFEDVGSRITGVDGVIRYTDADGYSSVRLRIAMAAGTTTATAKLSGAPTLTFSATGTPDRVCSVVLQFDVNLNVGAHWAETTTPIEARATDYFGNALAGYSVMIDTVTGGGTVTGLGATDATGVSRGTWRFGATLGAQRLYYTAQSCQYDLNRYPEGFTSNVDHVSREVNVQGLHVEKTGGDVQSGGSSQPLAAPLTVTVTAGGRTPPLAIAGAHVAWRVASGGGHVAPDTSVTDANGVASAALTLGPGSGTNTVWAVVAGDSTLFTAATTGITTTLTKTGGDNQSTAVTASLAQPLIVLLLDATGAPLPNATVAWDVQSGGGSVAPVSSTTDAAGRASTRWTMGPQPGTNEVVARAAGAPSVLFTATGQVFPPLASMQVGQGTCGLDASGAVYCWGGDPVGQFGNGQWDTVPHTTAQAMAPGWQFTSIAGNSQTACAISATDRKTYCWGGDRFMQVGSASAESCASGAPCVTTPTLVPGGQLYTQVASASSHSCGLTETGEAFCWGSNAYGALGTGSVGGATPPSRVNTNLRFSSISVANQNTCAIAANDGTGYCWGYNGFGELGNGNVATGSPACTSESRGGPGEVCSTLPVAVSGALSFTALEIGDYNGCGIAAGTTYCWGANENGQVGDGTKLPRFSPTAIALPTGVSLKQLALANAGSCGLTAGGAIFCWGQFFAPSSLSPVQIGVVNPAGAFTQLDVGGSSACALTTEGIPFCWGSNSSGQLGIGNTFSASIAQRVLGFGY